MSSTKNKNNSIELSDLNFHIENHPSFAKVELQKRKSQFISELTCLLFVHKDNKEIRKAISKLTLFSLNASENCFLDKVFTAKKKKMFDGYELRDYLIILKKIHKFLSQMRSLSEKERLEFYHLERYCIKRYLELSKFLW